MEILLCKVCILPFLSTKIWLIYVQKIQFLQDLFGIDIVFSLPAKACALLIYNPTLPGLVTGAFQWEQLEEDIKKKLKDPEKTEHVLEKVKCILKAPGKVHLTLLG